MELLTAADLTTQIAFVTNANLALVTGEDIGEKISDERPQPAKNATINRWKTPDP